MSAIPRYDTIIIGAGMSGLAAGIRLAYYDQRVCILERHYTIGGLNSFYRLRGRDYDVGLHAVTNFSPRGARHGPLARLLRQLRFRWDDFALSPQIGSAIAFPDVRLRFGNGIELLTAEVERAFPSQRDNFQSLVAKIIEYDDLDQEAFEISARQVLNETISDPLFAEAGPGPRVEPWTGRAAAWSPSFPSPQPAPRGEQGSRRAAARCPIRRLNRLPGGSRGARGPSRAIAVVDHGAYRMNPDPRGPADPKGPGERRADDAVHVIARPAASARATRPGTGRTSGPSACTCYAGPGGV